MKDIKTAITEDFLDQTAFAEIAQLLNQMTAEQKGSFAKACASGENGSFLKGVCLTIARTKMETKWSQISADGVITVQEFLAIMKRL